MIDAKARGVAMASKCMALWDYTVGTRVLALSQGEMGAIGGP